jgi:hypothetical protein
VTNDRPVPHRAEPAADPQRAASETQPATESPETAGGDPACWAGLVCQECGAVISEGHRAGCSQAVQPAGA